MIGGFPAFQLPFAAASSISSNPNASQSGVVYRTTDDGQCSCSKCGSTTDALVSRIGDNTIPGVAPEIASMMAAPIGGDAAVQGLPALNNGSTPQKAISLPSFSLNGGSSQNIMQMLMMWLPYLMQMLSGRQSQPVQQPQIQQPVFQQPQITQPTVTQNTTTPQVGQAPRLNGVNSAELQASLNKIAADPEGAKLLNEASRRGVSIMVGQTGASNVSGEYHPDKNLIIVRDANNIRTIVHEMIHAVSPQDGNSQTEEGIANVVGYRVSNRLIGTPTDTPDSIFNRTVALYPELPFSNSIRTTLGGLGLSV